MEKLLLIVYGTVESFGNDLLIAAVPTIVKTLMKARLDVSFAYIKADTSNNALNESIITAKKNASDYKYVMFMESGIIPNETIYEMIDENRTVSAMFNTISHNSETGAINLRRVYLIEEKPEEKKPEEDIKTEQQPEKTTETAPQSSKPKPAPQKGKERKEVKQPNYLVKDIPTNSKDLIKTDAFITSFFCVPSKFIEKLTYVPHKDWLANYQLCYCLSKVCDLYINPNVRVNNRVIVTI